MLATLESPPLALYIHWPWCVRKCPYCDFNSHEWRQTDGLPEQAYVEALITDLEAQLPSIWGRRLDSVFIGGGTPSLLSPEAMDTLLSALRARLPWRPDLEVTLEANPGTVEHGDFAEYRAVGINRLSLGIQSFDTQALQRLGRIHDGATAARAVHAARQAGFTRINLDLMFGLPGQDLAAGLADLQQAIALGTGHISWYQLTLEPNTLFAAHPPVLPGDDALAKLFARGQAVLRKAGYTRYEVSAYAKAGDMCRHNHNYWMFGDYLGIGAGAHGKLTDLAQQDIVRTSKPRQPETYLRDPTALTRSSVAPRERPFEFMLNALRLMDGVPTSLFSARTGLPLTAIATPLEQARAQGLLRSDPDWLRATRRGQRFLNNLLELFLHDHDTAN